MQIPQITFTRFLASISIVILHFGLFSWPMKSSLLAPLGGDLIAAMSYFFLLSGYILVISSAKNGILPDVINAKVFWFRRATRILPMYFLAMIIFFIINFRYDPSIPLKWQIQSYYHSIFLLQSWKYKMALDVNYPSWSLSVEAFFYLIFPWLYSNLRAVSNKKLTIVSIAAWSINLYVFISLKNENVPENFIKFFPLLHVATFITGMSFGIMFIRNYEWLEKIGKKYIQSATILATLIVMYTAYKDYEFFNYQHNGLLSPYYLLVIFSLALTKGKIGKLLSSKLFVFLGSISYSIYILQYPVYQICQKHIPWLKNQSDEDIFYVYIIILIFLSSLMYLLIEKTARKYLTNKYQDKLNTQKHNTLNK